MDAKKFILQWNQKFPLDRKWRQKYNVPFNSKLHREVTPFDIFIDLHEDVVFENLKDEYIQKLKHKDEYIKKGKLFKQVEASVDVYDEIYEKMDLDKFNTNKNGV